MNKLFSYGTLQQKQVQLDTFNRVLQGAPDTLTGYRLGEVRITDPAVLASSGKQYHPILIATHNSEDKVPGTLFELTDEELARADDYEVDEYTRVKAEFASGASGWIYAARE